MTGIVIDIEAKVDKAQGSIDALARSLAKISQNTSNIEKTLNTGALSKDLGKKPTEGITKLNRESNSLNDTMSKADRTFSGSFLNKGSDLKANKALEKTHDSLKGINDLAINLAGSLKSAFGAVAFGGAFAGLTKISSDFQDLENQIANVVGRSEQLTATMIGLNDVALRTRTLYASTTTVFTGFGRAMKDAKTSMDTLLGVTETIQKAVAVSGASAESANAALFQLNQGLSAGALRGEELNSVMEQTPRIAKAIADNLGVSLGKMRELASTGQITTNVVMKALVDQAKQINKEFALMKPTMAQGVSKLAEMLKSVASEFEKGLGLSDFFSEFLYNGVKALGELSKSAFEMGVNTWRVFNDLKERLKDFAEPIIFGFEKVVLKLRLLLGALGITTFVKKEIGEIKYLFDAYIMTGVRSYEAYGKALRSATKRGRGTGIWSFDDMPVIINSFKKIGSIYLAQVNVLGTRITASGQVLRENIKAVWSAIPALIGSFFVTKTVRLMKEYFEDMFDLRADVPRIIGRMGVYLFDALSSMFSRLGKAVNVMDIFGNFAARASDNRKVTQILTKTFSYIAKALANGFDYLATETKRLTDWSFLDYITDKSQSVSGRLKNSFTSLFSMKAGSFSFRKVFNTVVIELDNFAIKVTENFSKIQKGFNKFGISTKFTKIFDGISKDMAKAVSTIKNYFKSLEKGIVIKFDGDKLAKGLASILVSLKAAGTSLRNVATFLYKTFFTIRDTLLALDSAFQSAGVYNRLANGLKYVENLFSSFARNIREKFKGIEAATNISFSVKDLANSINKIFDGVEAKTRKLESAFEAIADFGKNVIEVFFKIYDAVIGNSWWTDTVETVVDTSKNLKNNTDGGLKQFAGNVIRVFEGVYKVIVNIFDRISNVDITTNLQKMLGSIRTISPMAANILSDIGDGVAKSFAKIKSVVADVLKSDFVINISTGNFKKAFTIAKDFVGGLFDKLPEELQHALKAFANVFGLAFVSLLLPENRITSLLGGVFLRAALLAGMAFANVFADLRFGVSFAVEAGKVAGNVAGTVLLGLLADLPGIISNLLGFIGGAIEGFLKSIPIVGTVASIVYGILDLFQFSTAGGLLGALLFGGPALKMLSTLGIFEKQISRVFKIAGAVGSFFSGTLANTAVAGHNMTRLMSNPSNVGMGPPLPPGMGYQARPQSAASRASSSFFSPGNAVSSGAMVGLMADQLGMFDQVFYDSPLGHAYMQGGLIALALMGPEGISRINESVIRPVLNSLSTLIPDNTIRGNLARMFGTLGSMIRDPSILAGVFSGLRERFTTALTPVGTTSFMSRFLFGPTGIPATALGMAYNSFESFFVWVKARAMLVAPGVVSALTSVITPGRLIATLVAAALIYSNTASASTETPDLMGGDVYQGIQQKQEVAEVAKTGGTRTYQRMPIPRLSANIPFIGKTEGTTVLQEIVNKTAYAYDNVSERVRSGILNIKETALGALPNGLKSFWENLSPSQSLFLGITAVAAAFAAFVVPLAKLLTLASPMRLFMVLLSGLGNQLMAFQGVAASSGAGALGLNMKSYLGIIVRELFLTLKQMSPLVAGIATKLSEVFGPIASGASSKIKQVLADRAAISALNADAARGRSAALKPSRFENLIQKLQPPSATFMGPPTALQKGTMMYPNLLKTLEVVQQKGKELANGGVANFVPKLRLMTQELWAMGRAAGVMQSLPGKFLGRWIGDLAAAITGVNGLTFRLSLMGKVLAGLMSMTKFLWNWKALFATLAVGIVLKIPFLQDTDESKAAGKNHARAFMGSFESFGKTIDVASWVVGLGVPALMTTALKRSQSRVAAVTQEATAAFNAKVAGGLLPPGAKLADHVTPQIVRDKILKEDVLKRYDSLTGAQRGKEYRTMPGMDAFPRTREGYLGYYQANPNRANIGMSGSLAKGFAGVGAGTAVMGLAAVGGAAIGNKFGGEVGAGIGAGLASMFSMMLIPMVTGWLMSLSALIGPAVFATFGGAILAGGLLASFLMGSTGSLVDSLIEVYDWVKKIIGIHSEVKDVKSGMLAREVTLAREHGLKLQYDATKIKESNIQDPRIYEKYTKSIEEAKKAFDALETAKERGSSYGDTSNLQKDAEKAVEILNKNAAAATRASKFDIQKGVDFFSSFEMNKFRGRMNAQDAFKALTLPTEMGNVARIKPDDVSKSGAFLTPAQEGVKARILSFKKLEEDALALSNVTGLDDAIKTSLSVASDDLVDFTEKVSHDLSGKTVTNLLNDTFFGKNNPQTILDAANLTKAEQVLKALVARGAELKASLEKSDLYQTMVSSLIGNLKDANVTIKADDLLPESEGNIALARMKDLGLEAKRLKDQLDKIGSAEERNRIIAQLSIIGKQAQMAQDVAADAYVNASSTVVKNAEAFGLKNVEALKYVDNNLRLELSKQSMGAMVNATPYLTKPLPPNAKGPRLSTNPFQMIRPVGDPFQQELSPIIPISPLVSEGLTPNIKPLAVPIIPKQFNVEIGASLRDLDTYLIKAKAARALIDTPIPLPTLKARPSMTGSAEDIRILRENSEAQEHFNELVNQREFAIAHIQEMETDIGVMTNRLIGADPFASIKQSAAELGRAGFDYAKVFEDYGKGSADAAIKKISGLKDAIEMVKAGDSGLVQSEWLPALEKELDKAEAAIAHRDIAFPEFGLDAPRKFKRVSTELISEINSIDANIFKLQSDIKLANKDPIQLKSLNTQLADAEKRRDAIKASLADLTTKISTVNEAYGINLSTAVLAGLPSKLWSQLSTTATQYKSALEEAMKESDMTPATEALAASFENLKSHASFLGFFGDMKTRLRETLTDGFTSTFDKIKSALPDLSITSTQYAAMSAGDKAALQSSAETIRFSEELQKLNSMSGDMYQFATSSVKQGMPVNEILIGMQSRFSDEFAKLNIADKLKPATTPFEMFATSNETFKSSVEEFKNAVTGAPTTTATATDSTSKIGAGKPFPASGNVGNLKNYDGTPGFQKFDSIEAGVEKLKKQIGWYTTRHGIDTLSAFTAKFAPKSDHNDPVLYAATLASKIGIGIADKVNFAEPKLNEQMAIGIAEQEGGWDIRSILAAKPGISIADKVSVAQPATEKAVSTTLPNIAQKVNTVSSEVASSFEIWLNNVKAAGTNQASLNRADMTLAETKDVTGFQKRKAMILEAGYTEDAFNAMSEELKNYALSVAAKIAQDKLNLSAAINTGQPTKQSVQDKLNIAAGIEGTNKGLAASTLPTTLAEMQKFEEAASGNVTAFLQTYSGMSAENIGLLSNEEKASASKMVHEKANLEYQMAADAKAGKSTTESSLKILDLGDKISEMGDKAMAAAKVAKDVGMSFATGLTGGFNDALKGLMHGEKNKGESVFQTFAGKLKQNLIDSTINSFSTGITNSLGMGKGGAIENMASGLGEGIFNMFGKGLNAIPGVPTASKATSGFFGDVGTFFREDVGNFFGGKAEGGPISGPGTGTSDSIMARLSNGEFVINAKSTAKYGTLIDAINQDKMPKFAKGGLLGNTNAFSNQAPIFSNAPVLSTPIQTDVTVIGGEDLIDSAKDLTRASDDLSMSAGIGTSLWQQIANMYNDTTTSIGTGVIDVAKEVGKFFADTGKWVWSGVINVYDKTAALLNKAGNFVWDGVVNVAGIISSNLPSMSAVVTWMGGGNQSVTGTVNSGNAPSVTATISKWVDSAGNAIGDVWNGLVGKVKLAKDFVVATISEWYDDAGNLIGEGWKAVKGTLKGINLDTISATFNGWTDSAGNLIGEAWKGVTGVFTVDNMEAVGGAIVLKPFAYMYETLKGVDYSKFFSIETVGKGFKTLLTPFTWIASKVAAMDPGQYLSLDTAAAIGKNIIKPFTWIGSQIMKIPFSDYISIENIKGISATILKPFAFIGEQLAKINWSEVINFKSIGETSLDIIKASGNGILDVGKTLWGWIDNGITALANTNIDWSGITGKVGTSVWKFITGVTQGIGDMLFGQKEGGMAGTGGSATGFLKSAAGVLRGQGTGTSDSIPVMLSNGEYIVPADMTRQYAPVLDAMRSGEYPTGSVKDLNDLDAYITKIKGSANYDSDKLKEAFLNIKNTDGKSLFPNLNYKPISVDKPFGYTSPYLNGVFEGGKVWNTSAEYKQGEKSAPKGSIISSIPKDLAEFYDYILGPPTSSGFDALSPMQIEFGLHNQQVNKMYKEGLIPAPDYYVNTTSAAGKGYYGLRKIPANTPMGGFNEKFQASVENPSKITAETLASGPDFTAWALGKTYGSKAAEGEYNKLLATSSKLLQDQMVGKNIQGILDTTKALSYNGITIPPNEFKSLLAGGAMDVGSWMSDGFGSYDYNDKKTSEATQALLADQLISNDKGISWQPSLGAVATPDSLFGATKDVLGESVQKIKTNIANKTNIDNLAKSGVNVNELLGFKLDSAMPAESQNLTVIQKGEQLSFDKGKTWVDVVNTATDNLNVPGFKIDDKTSGGKALSGLQNLISTGSTSAWLYLREHMGSLYSSISKILKGDFSNIFGEKITPLSKGEASVDIGPMTDIEIIPSNFLGSQGKYTPEKGFGTTKSALAGDFNAFGTLATQLAPVDWTKLIISESGKIGLSKVQIPKTAWDSLGLAFKDLHFAPSIQQVDYIDDNGKRVQDTIYGITIGGNFGLGAATGGLITGAGTGTSDSIPTMLSNGEYVINAAATSRNRELLEAINSGATISSAASPIMAIPTASKSADGANSVTNNSVINMNITGDISRQTRAEISQMLPQIAAGVNQYNRERNYRG
jgi:tape measure domain-containing protein